MMSQLTESLRRIETWLQQNRVTVFASLQLALTEQEIDEKVKVLPFRPSKEFYEFYEWHNGMRGYDYEVQFFHYHRFLSLGEALDIYDAVTKATEDWNPFWFPLFSYDGEYWGCVSPS